MTGIEWLREFAKGCRLTGQRAYSNAIGDIADQIERERARDSDTIENLRLELGEARDHAAGVSTSAYDLLPEEDRDAVAWVREHGGLGAVRKMAAITLDVYQRLVDDNAGPEMLETDADTIDAMMAEIVEAIIKSGKERTRALELLDESVPRVTYERHIIKRQRQIDESHAALRRRRETISELNHRVSDLTRENAELRKRAMPEGMSWPVFEDGEPVRIGDVVSDVEVRSVVFRDGGILLSDCTSVPGWGTWRSYKEPINRPAPKVLDADGEEREAIAWVRKYGGLEKVKLDAACWNTAENIAQTTLDWLARVCSVAGIEKCGYGIALERLEDAISSRLMPEGMEWLVEAWPRFKDDAPVRFLDDFERYGEESGVSAVTMYADGSFALNFRAYSRGERVNRPAPKVLDADGMEIREKRDVWWICEGDERGVHAERLRVETICPNGLIECSPYNGGTWVYLEPSELYVNKPVPASDGKPLREGETVWDMNGDELVIGALEDGGHTVTCRYVDVGDAIPVHGMWSPSQLTHERPVADTWERLEEDATVSPEAYCAKRGIDFSDVDGQHRVLDEVTERMARDLVSRARALAERGE